MTLPLRVPCAYQGGKQRVAKQIVDVLLSSKYNDDTVFYDLCCGSGAISIELVNRGIMPSRIVMVDLSSWASFWTAIGNGTFDMDEFQRLLAEIPADKHKVKEHMTQLASLLVLDHEAEVYPILQACSFGGKQIWYDGSQWVNAFFRDYWEPTATSIRRSPANPMQPSPRELERRVHALVAGMRGVSCFRADVMAMMSHSIPSNAVVYMDPPYRGTTGYAFDFDVLQFVNTFRTNSNAPLFVSEGRPLNPDATQLTFGGAKGGISGNKISKHQEWLSRF